MRRSASKRRSGARGASASTATGTTAIGDAGRPARSSAEESGAREGPYTGRFAPSPTGRLHLGSLVAAVGSFLDARSHGGRWLVRMEDLDADRVVPGSTSDILRCLEACGLEWDGAIEYQSRRRALYDRALETLADRGLTYPCSCPRSTRATPDRQVYPGTCRRGPTRTGPTALRFRVEDGVTIRFTDRVQGPCEYPLAKLGDPVVRRREGIQAYQLAVVVDDAAQAATDVVRGADLLPSTAWQIALCQALGVPPVRYAHLPLVVEPDGSKLAKSRRSVPVDPARPGVWLARSLELLGHGPPVELYGAPPDRLIAWATERWALERLRYLRTVPLPKNGFGSGLRM